jgi:hypothetical protein
MLSAVRRPKSRNLAFLSEHGGRRRHNRAYRARNTDGCNGITLVGVASGREFEVLSHFAGIL